MNFPASFCVRQNGPLVVGFADPRMLTCNVTKQVSMGKCEMLEGLTDILVNCFEQDGQELVSVRVS